MDMIGYYHDKNILITGGLGFIGSNIARRLVGLGARITIIDDLHPLYGGNQFNIDGIRDRITVVINDVRDERVMVPLVTAADVIFHLAAQVSYIDSLRMPYEDMDLNARATLSILETCRKHNPHAKIIFASSRMVLGKVEGTVMRENSPANPLSLYGIHKLTSEKYLGMYYKDFNIPYVVMRITNPYGPRQQVKHNKYSLVGWFIRQAMEGKTIQIFGDGRQLRDYIYADDIVEAFVLCASCEGTIGEIINVGSGSATAFGDMVGLVIEAVQNGSIAYIPWPTNYEKIETGDIAADISKIHRLTGWQPRISLPEGIHLTFEYYRSHLERYFGGDL